MYAIEQTFTDHETGQVQTFIRKRPNGQPWKTLRAAERTARSWRWACKPDGKTLISESAAKVIEIN